VNMVEIDEVTMGLPRKYLFKLFLILT
jgi:hypothetical protein